MFQALFGIGLSTAGFMGLTYVMGYPYAWEAVSKLFGL